MKIMTQLLLSLCLVLGVGNVSKADAFSLPDPTNNSYLFGDFNSYSLPLLAYQYDLINGGGTGPGSPYYVASSPGIIKDYIVVGTGTSSNPAVTNFPGMDNAYPTPNKNPDNFSTATTPDPNPAIANDSQYLWDSTLDAFTTYLAGASPVFFFNNNEENSDAAAEQTLWAWGQVILSDAQGVAPNIYFDFTNTPVGGSPPPSADPSTYTNTLGAGLTLAGANTWVTLGDYVLSGGQVCVNGAGIPQACDGTQAETINHNLGANQAAYAIISQELNAFLASWTSTSAYDTFSIDFRFRDINNGYEQVFITTTENVVPVPEPSTVVLLLSGIFGLFIYQRKRKS